MEAEINADEDISDDLPSQFAILERIAGGGMGIVYRAKDSLLDRIVAIKVLSITNCSEDDTKRFLRETKVLSDLTHSNIVHLYSGGISKSGLPFIVMEYLKGQTLAKLLESRGAAISVSEVIEIFKQVLPAVSFAHKKGVIHRDISTSNIFLVEGGSGISVKLLDFGLARSFLPAEDVKLTGTGELRGNPSYMSPEQCRGVKELGPQSDIYSLACIIFECLSGRPLFSAGSSLELMYKHQNEAADLHALGDNARKAGLSAVLEKCLNKEAEKRYESIDHLSGELFECLIKLHARKTSSGRAPSKVFQFVLLVVLIGLLAAFLVSTNLSQHNRSSQERRDLDKTEKSAAVYFREGEKLFAEAVRHERQGESFQARQFFEKVIPKMLSANQSALSELENSPSGIGSRQLRTIISKSSKDLSIANEKLGYSDESAKYYKVYIDTAFAQNKEGSDSPVVAEADRYGLIMGYINMLKFACKADEAISELERYTSKGPREITPGACTWYSELLSELAYAELMKNNFSRANEQAFDALKILTKAGIQESFHASFNEILVAFGFNGMKKPLQMAEHFDAAGKFQKITRAKPYDVQIRTLILAGMLVRNTRGFEASKEYFQAALDRGLEIKYPLTYSLALDSFAEVAVEEGDYDTAESLARVCLKERSDLDRRNKKIELEDLDRGPVSYKMMEKAASQSVDVRALGRCPALSYRILAETSFLKSEDKKALEFIEAGVKQSQAVPVSKDILLALGLIKARLLLRASENLKGDELARTRKEALQQFSASSALFDHYEYRWRKFYRDAAGEYSRLRAAAR